MKKVFVVYQDGLKGAFMALEDAEALANGLKNAGGEVYLGETTLESCIDAAEALQSVRVFFEGKEMGDNAIDIDAEELLAAIKNA